MAIPTQILNNGMTPGLNDNPFAPQSPAPKAKSNKSWIIASVAGGSALVFGGLGVGAYTLVHKGDEPIVNPNEGGEQEGEEQEGQVQDGEENEGEEQEGEEQEIVDADVEPSDNIVTITFDPSQVHQSFAVNDDMSFAEAFAAAREDVGAGGVFVWHGGVYGTYTADEWNSMSHEDQLAFSSSFHYEEHSTLVAEHPILIESDPVVSDPNDVALVVEDEEPEIMLVSQEYDEENDMHLAIITNGDDVAMLADVDNDGTYDFLVSDFDGNGEISNDEIIDISDSNLTQAAVNNLPEYHDIDPYDDVMA